MTSDNPVCWTQSTEHTGLPSVLNTEHRTHRTTQCTEQHRTTQCAEHNAQNTHDNRVCWTEHRTNRSHIHIYPCPLYKSGGSAFQVYKRIIYTCYRYSHGDNVYIYTSIQFIFKTKATMLLNTDKSRGAPQLTIEAEQWSISSLSLIYEHPFSDNCYYHR